MNCRENIWPAQTQVMGYEVNACGDTPVGMMINELLLFTVKERLSVTNV